MKNESGLFYFVLTAFMALWLSACCTKKDCSGFDAINTVQLSDFSPEEVDSIFIEVFPAATGFTASVDSSFTSAIGGYGSDSVWSIQLPERLNSFHDYQITLLSNGLVYQIENLNKNRKKCNNCFLRKDDFDALSSYEVNGQQQFGVSIVIHR